MGTAPNWLSRYESGQRDQVWLELLRLGDRVRESGWADEAQLVCDVMARRARHNVELIVERLTADGYRFHRNDDEQTPVRPHVPPTPAAGACVAWLEETFGPVPMTLSSWVRIVGDVWLVGTHPEWEASSAADPLVFEVERARSASAHLEREWADHREAEPGAAGLFVLPTAPDMLHKSNTSGGGPYGIVLPDDRADGLFSWETTMPFVSYLNWVFANGGFPWDTGEDGQWAVRYRLGRDLLVL
ncbi:hypothetical protein [Nocardia sp. NRRL S-836]|uniref:hypothetical protein n=1 Tax=Nocardia sp. NRRL S-836 TaxID=1519492 RepID=UPI0006ADDE9B|nr:hypothetical protein [Nocardia sp. NRRL S-836]KOV82852.1 hypothetical protein ADL03_22420 [Nocardia sp. NRRL S-836]